MISQDYKTMITYAVKAPSGHNTQPWLFEVDEGRITITPNFSKALPVVDPNHRELFISLGCATENLIIAAASMGYTCEVEISEDHHIIIQLQKTTSAPENTEQLQVLTQRQTNKNSYNQQMIPASTLDSIITTLDTEDDISVYTWQNHSEYFEILKQAILKGNESQMNNQAFVEELKSWIRFNKKQSESTNDGLSYATSGAPSLPTFLAKLIIGSFLNSKKQNQGDMKKIDSSSHFVLFTTKNDSIEEWINLGRYLQRFLLSLTQAGIAHAYMNQPCEESDIATQLQSSLPIDNQYPSLLLRIGYAAPAAYSKRKDINEVIIKK